MFYNYLSQLQNLPSWAESRVCLPPLYEAEWLIESIQVTYIQSWEKLVVVAVSICIFGFLQGTIQGTVIGTALRSNVPLNWFWHISSGKTATTDRSKVWKLNFHCWKFFFGLKIGLLKPWYPQKVLIRPLVFQLRKCWSKVKRWP